MFNTTHYDELFGHRQGTIYGYPGTSCSGCHNTRGWCRCLACILPRVHMESQGALECGWFGSISGWTTRTVNDKDHGLLIYDYSSVVFVSLPLLLSASKEQIQCLLFELWVIGHGNFCLRVLCVFESPQGFAGSSRLAQHQGGTFSRATRVWLCSQGQASRLGQGIGGVEYLCKRRLNYKTLGRINDKRKTMIRRKIWWWY